MTSNGAPNKKQENDKQNAKAAQQLMAFLFGDDADTVAAALVRDAEAEIAAAGTSSKVVELNRNTSFRSIQDSGIRVAASNRAGAEVGDLVPFLEFDAVGRSFVALADDQGRVMISGTIDNDWTHVIVGKTEYRLERDATREGCAWCAELGQADLEALAFDTTDSNGVRFR